MLDPPLTVPPPNSSMLASSPPDYSPSSASPSYAVEPRNGEQRLELVARPQPSTPQGTFIHKARHLTVSFNEQEPDATVPTYSRNAAVKGEIDIKDVADVVAVTLKLEGRQVLSVGEGGQDERVFFSESHELWRKRGSASCPTLLGFYIPFPMDYVDDQGTHQLPPSFDARFSGVPGLSARNTYSVSIVMARTRLASWKTQKSLCIPVNYYPRSRPFRPIARPMHPFFSTLKTLPEEWHQVTSTLRTRVNSASSVDCHLFIPDVQIYALSDTIPFHLQLRGPAHSLRTFMGLSEPSLDATPRRVMSRSSDTSSLSLAPSYLSWAAVRNPSTLFGTIAGAPGLRKQSGDVGKPGVRVHLLRQISAKAHGQKGWRNVVLGEGKLVPVEHPPSWSPSAALDEEEQALDWEGEVRCNGDVSTASFLAGGLHVKDFIVVNLRPSDPQHSPLVEHQHAHPIRLVTDPYRETFSHPSDE